MNRITAKIPLWSLCYLVNGDATALEDEEIVMVDNWVNDWGVQIVSPLVDETGSDNSYFDPFPIFGPASDVVECEIR